MPKKNNNKTKKSISKKSIPKSNSKKLKKRSMKSNISKEKYKKLLKSKRLSKKNKKLLNDELLKKYCRCIKTLKKSKDKKLYDGKYGICMNSIYKNRGLKPPFNVVRECDQFYKY